MKIDWKLHRSFVYGDWESDVTQAVAQVVSPGMVTFDVGAHIGFYTLLLAKLVGPEGIVVAFEPLPQNFDVLRQNIDLNHCGRVRAVNKAVLDRDGPAAIAVPEDAPLPGSVYWGRREGWNLIPVDAVSLDSFLKGKDSPVHFIKMDVEGSEGLALRGARRLVETWHPTMMIEIHHRAADGSGQDALPLLQGWGYDVRWINRDELTSHVLARWDAPRPGPAPGHR